VPLYLAKYVAINFAFVPIYMTLINGITHVIGSLSLRRYNPGLYTLLFPGGILLLVYFNRIAPSAFQPARPACCRDRGLRLRPLLCNCLDQKTGKVTQRPTETLVEHLPACVGCHLGRQTGQ
jgi:hypothetical protein